MKSQIIILKQDNTPAGAGVASVNGRSGVVSLGKSDVGLSNVDNTSDATKNAATATLTNKTLTSPAINAPTGIVKGDVGLGNVDNTSNATERAATATLTNKTIAGGSNTISGITEAMQSTSDVTTGNVSTSKHGYAPKAPNDASKYLDGTGAYSVPAGGGGGGGTGDVVGPTGAVSGNIPIFNGTSGKSISDSGAVPLNGVLTSAGAGDSGKVPLLNGAGVLDVSFDPAITGDVTKPAGSAASTLATVNSNVGSFTNANITVNAKGLVTAAADGAGGGGGGDMFSTLTSAEIAITNASTTLTIGRMHAIKATSANQTNALPAVSGNAGKFIGIRITFDSTKLVTIDGNASETIDQLTTRVMWAKESAILMCDGTEWKKVSGRTIPMSANMSTGSSQSVPNITDTKMLVDTSNDDPTGQMVDTTNHKIVLLRPGRYQVHGKITIISPSSSINTQTVVRKNGTALDGVFLTYPSGEVIQVVVHGPTRTAAAADYYEVWAYQGAGGAQGTVYGDLWIDEVPSW